MLHETVGMSFDFNFSNFVRIWGVQNRSKTLCSSKLTAKRASWSHASLGENWAIVKKVTCGAGVLLQNPYVFPTERHSGDASRPPLRHRRAPWVRNKTLFFAENQQKSGIICRGKWQLVWTALHGQSKPSRACELTYDSIPCRFNFRTTHMKVGLLSILLALLQALNGYLRPKNASPGESQRPQRVVWQYLHM